MTLITFCFTESFIKKRFRNAVGKTNTLKRFVFINTPVHSFQIFQMILMFVQNNNSLEFNHLSVENVTTDCFCLLIYQAQVLLTLPFLMRLIEINRFFFSFG